jgi:hypothetical protein
MGTPGKTVSIVKKILVAAAALVIAFSAVFVIFKKTGLFVYLIEGLAGNYLNMTVEIGSLDLFTDGHRIVITDVNISGPDKDDIRIVLPRIEINSSLSGLLVKNIDELSLSGPSVYLPAEKIKMKSGRGGKIDLPFQKAVISEASVTLQVDTENAFHIDMIDISLTKDAERNLAQLSGSARIPELGSRLRAEAEIDLGRPALNKGRVGISAEDINKAMKYAPAIKNDNIRGAIDLSINAERKRTDTEDTIQWSLASSLRGLIFRSQTLAVNLKDKDLETESRGIYDLKRNFMKIALFRMRLSDEDLLTLYGTVENIFTDKPEMRIAVECRSVPIRKVRDLVSGSHVDWIRAIDTNGVINANAVVKGKLSAIEMEGKISLTGETLSWKNVQLHSFSVRLPFTFEGNSLILKNAAVTAANAKGFSSSGKDALVFNLQNVKFFSPFMSYKASMVWSETFRIDADRAVVSGDNKEYLAENRVSVKGILEGNTEDLRFEVKNIILNTDLIKTVSGSVRFHMNDPVTIDADIAHDHIDIKEFSQRFFPEILRQKDIHVKGLGAIQGAFRVTIPENALSIISGTVRLTLSNASFSSSDETTTCEGIEMKASSTFESSLPFSQINFAIDSETTGFELLMGRFYGSFKDRVLRLTARGRYAKSDDSVRINESHLSLSRIGNMAMTGTVSEVSESPLLDADIQISDLSNSEAYDLFIRDNFREESPVLSRLKVDGESSAQLHISGRLKRFSAHGNIRIADMNVIDKDPERYVRGIDISIPVDLAYPEAPQTHGTEDFGSLRIKDISWSAIKLRDIEAHPSILKNTLIFKEDISLPVMGGDIILKNIFYSDILSPERQLRLAVDIKNIDLELAGASFALPRFSGRLSGAAPLVRLSQNRLFTNGEIVLDLFGGKMKVADLSIDNVFSPIMSLKSSIEFQEIDLGQLTGTFDFGNISGVIRGKISDLVIVNGQAERFVAFVESYKKKGLSQKINVEALKKISILGTGSSTSILDRGIYRFFREYRYEKLGLRASLKNDNLLLLGIENEGDRGYLVKGGLLPPKVDVISYTQNISFQEMIIRLKRIKQAER